MTNWGDSTRKCRKAESTRTLNRWTPTRKAGGGIILTVPQHPLLWSALDDYSFHKRRYTRRELVQKVQRAGFTLLRATSFVSLLLPLMAVSRMKKRRMRASFDPVAELKISPILDRALEKVLGIERIAIQNGISFPAGSSLLVVARRDSR